MKNFLISILSLSLLSFASCEKPANTDDTGDAGLTISVDKNQIEADGKDIATFTIVDSEGNVMTTEENSGRIFFKNVSDGTRLPRYSTGFTSIADGEYEFVGIYNGKETSNSLKINAVNRAQYEKFHRNVAVFKLTGTWCSNCPRMTSALHSLGDDAASHSVVLACHYEETKSHPFYVDYNGMALGMYFFVYMDADQYSFPTNCYDMVELNTSSSTVTIAERIMERRIESPAAVGIKVSSFQLEGNTLKVSASVKASAAGTYDMACALVADDLVYEGGYTDNDENKYSNVVLAVSGNNFMRYTSATSFQLGQDAEYQRDFEFALTSAPSSDLLEDMRAVVLVHRKNADSSSEVNNCAECGYGKTLDYRYN